MRRLVRGLDLATNGLMLLSGAVIALMVLHIGLDVSSRYLFNRPLPGTVELVSQYYMVVLIFLPLPFVERMNAHFVAGVFTDKLPVRTLARLEAFTSLLMALVAALIAWCAVDGALYATRTDEQEHVGQFVLHTWQARWLMPLGLAMMALYALMNAAKRLATGKPAGTEASV